MILDCVLSRVNNVILWTIKDMDETLRGVETIYHDKETDMMIKSRWRPCLICSCIYLRGSYEQNDTLTDATYYDTVDKAIDMFGQYKTTLLHYADSFNANEKHDSLFFNSYTVSVPGFTVILTRIYDKVLMYIPKQSNEVLPNIIYKGNYGIDIRKANGHSAELQKTCVFLRGDNIGKQAKKQLNQLDFADCDAAKHYYDKLVGTFKDFVSNPLGTENQHDGFDDYFELCI